MPADLQDRPSLTDTEIADLARLGARVTTHYEGFPQDIEWALRDSRIYLLQSRPVTGVEFSWDAEVDAGQPIPDDPQAIRTRAVADEGWNGAITPLMYSWRGPNWNTVFWDGLAWMGRPDLKQHRIWQYHKGYVYWNCEFERGLIEETIPAFRFVQLHKIPTPWHAEALAAPFSVLAYAKQFAGQSDVTTVMTVRNGSQTSKLAPTVIPICPVISVAPVQCVTGPRPGIAWSGPTIRNHCQAAQPGLMRSAPPARAHRR